MTSPFLADDPGPFFAHSTMSLAVLSAAGIIVRANAAFLRAFPAGDPVGRSLASIVRASDRGRVEQALRTQTLGELPKFDAIADSAPGAGHGAMCLHLTRHTSGEILVAAVPISHQSEDEARLAVFDKVVDSGAVGYFAIDSQGIYTASQGRVGERIGNAVGKSALDIWKGTEAHDSVARALAGEEAHALVSAPGLDSEFWYLPVQGPDGLSGGAVGFVIDQTSQREAERTLREKLTLIEMQNATLELLSRVLANAPLILWAMDEDGRVTHAEGRGMELLGFQPKDLIGVNALEMHKEQTNIVTALTKALNGESTRVLSPLGPGIHFENWYMPLRGEDGSLEGAIGLSIDATDRVRSEGELREKLDVIERQNATIRELATPIIKIWDGVLCLPVIGTVDSSRTAEMMHALLEAIVQEQAQFAIVDLTGVDTVDTTTADSLIQLFRAARVLGVDGVLCGIRPAVAQTVVTLGLDLGSVKTMRSLRDALGWCISSRGDQLSRAKHSGGLPLVHRR